MKKVRNNIILQLKDETCEFVKHSTFDRFIAKVAMHKVRRQAGKHA